MFRARLLPVTFAVASSLLAGCAGMIAGSEFWFERKKPDVEPLAASDLDCKGKPIEFTPVTMGDYREVEARGCGKKAQYQLVKVGFAEDWKRSSDVTPM